MTATAAAILVLFERAVFSAIVIPFPFKITRMTGGTEWRVLDRGIHKRSGHDTTVARATIQVPSVITRVVALRIMIKTGRCPAICYMTGITLHIRGNVTL